MRRLRFLAALVVFCLSVSGVALPPCPPPDIEAEVTRVIDGDTVEVRLTRIPETLSTILSAGSIERVRYIGVQAPEADQPNGPEATALNLALIAGKTVYLELDQDHRDTYGRLLAYVYLDANGYFMINLALIATPIIGTRAYPGTTRYADVFEAVDKAQPSQCGGECATPLTLEILSVTSPVNPGGYATLQARTISGANCTITVWYKSGPSKATGLEPKLADAQGIVTWTWKVGTKTTPGTWRILVTAELCSQAVSQETAFTVR